MYIHAANNYSGKTNPCLKIFQVCHLFTGLFKDIPVPSPRCCHICLHNIFPSWNSCPVRSPCSLFYSLGIFCSILDYLCRPDNLLVSGSTLSGRPQAERHEESKESVEQHQGVLLPQSKATIYLLRRRRQRNPKAKDRRCQ